MNQDEKNKIRDIYEQSLVVPQSKAKKQYLLCAIGLIGAGKTTVMKPLSEELGILRICTDDIRKLLKEHGYGYDEAKNISVELVHKYLGLGYSIVIDGDSVTEESQKIIADTEKKYAIKALWIHIHPPEEFIINKLKNFKHTWLFRDGEHAVSNYLMRKPLHKHLTMHFIYTFDTSRDDLAKQIDEAAARIREELLERDRVK